MKNNYKELLNQFKNARGVKNIDVNSAEFIKDFSNWIEERQMIGKRYLNRIKKLGLYQDSLHCAEVNKGINDSITIGDNTKLITPYIDSSLLYDSNRVIEGDFYVNKQYVFPFVSNDDVLMKVISSKDVNTYMTNNPYSFDMIDGWDALNNSRHNDIIVGVYGNAYDKDRQDKIEELLRFRKRLRNISEIDYTIGDRYFYVVASSKNKSNIRTR